jgi:hypothetical protein
MQHSRGERPLQRNVQRAVGTFQLVIWTICERAVGTFQLVMWTICKDALRFQGHICILDLTCIYIRICSVHVGRHTIGGV